MIIFIGINKFIKRFFDIVSSGVLLILLIPFMAIIAIAVRLDSKGPIFFVQRRRTLHGREFNMYKYRSMIVDAESMGSGLCNYKDDPRVTKVGKFLRETSLDELPQLLNIFLGDMSVVGPRPPVAYEFGDFETINKRFRKRFEVRGGLTGYAQIKGRNDNDWNEKVDLDNKYIDLFKKYGVVVDIAIIFQTVFRVFKKDQVYETKADATMTDEEAARQNAENLVALSHEPD